MDNEKRRTFILLALLMALALALRFERPTLVEFKRDEATVARIAQAIAYEGYLPAVGVDASMGIDNLPLTLYLMALPARLWRDPLAPVLFTMLLNTLAVWGCYAFGKAYFDTKTGLIAALLFAVNPWAVLYARKIWCQNMPWATLVFFAAVFATFVKGRRWAIVVAFVGVAALLGLHLSGLAAIPILGLAILLYRDKVTWKTLAAGVLAALFAVLPYIVYDGRHGWENVRGVFDYAGGASVFSWDAVRFAFMLAGSYGIPGQAGALHEQFADSVLNLWWMNHAMSGLLVMGLIYAAVQVVRGETRAQRRTFALMLIWFFIPIALQLRPSTSTQPHYFIILYPTQFLLVAVVLVRGLERFSRRRFVVGKVKFTLPSAALALVLLVWSVWQISVINQQRVYMVEHPTTGGYGIPLVFTRAAAQNAVSLAGDGEIIVVGENNRPFMTETPTVFEALLFGQPHRFTDGRAVLPVPESARTVYLVGPLPNASGGKLQPALERMARWGTVTEGPAVMLAGSPATMLADGWSYRTFVREGTTRDEVIAGMTPLAAGIPFANNVVFAAYEAPDTVEGGDTLDVWLAWWTRGLPPEGQDYHFTVQMLDENGALRAQNDHAGFPSATWKPGDLALSRFAIPVPAALPAGTYQLRAGMYSYPDIVSVAVVDAQGVPVDDGLNLGPVTITAAP